MAALKIDLDSSENSREQPFLGKGLDQKFKGSLLHGRDDLFNTAFAATDLALKFALFFAISPESLRGAMSKRIKGQIDYSSAPCTKAPRAHTCWGWGRTQTSAQTIRP